MALVDNMNHFHRPNEYPKPNCVEVGLKNESLASAKKTAHTPVDQGAKVLELDGEAVGGMMD